MLAHVYPFSILFLSPGRWEHNHELQPCLSCVSNAVLECDIAVASFFLSAPEQTTASCVVAVGLYWAVLESFCGASVSVSCVSYVLSVKHAVSLSCAWNPPCAFDLTCGWNVCFRFPPFVRRRPPHPQGPNGESPKGFLSLLAQAAAVTAPDSTGGDEQPRLVDGFQKQITSQGDDNLRLGRGNPLWRMTPGAEHGDMIMSISNMEVRRFCWRQQVDCPSSRALQYPKSVEHRIPSSVSTLSGEHAFVWSFVPELHELGLLYRIRVCTILSTSICPTPSIAYLAGKRPGAGRIWHAYGSETLGKRRMSTT